MIPAVELIERKRDGGELPAAELTELVLAHARGEVPDEQMAAFCMAVYFRGLTAAETMALTDAMVRSGETVDLSALGRVVVDKHSTGGVGDKVSVALAPLVASCGVPFAKMSGRGLGHTGGTLDKLESIPGFRIGLTADELVSQVARVGVAVVGQTEGIVPADRRLYALRDVTATVPQVSLIAASVMSKKIAAGADAILLDVKVGDGAFMRTREEALLLAETMLELGRRAGRRVACELTAMDEPLGAAVGNALEVREALAILRGDGPPDSTDLVLRSAVRLLAMSDLRLDEGAAQRLVRQRIGSGDAVATYERWVEAQGGDPSEDRLPVAPVVRSVDAPRVGFVTGVSALAIGRAVVHLGAGRRRKEDAIDHAAGVVCLAKTGAPVAAGEPLAEVHAADAARADAAVAEVAAAYSIGEEPPAPAALILEELP